MIRKEWILLQISCYWKHQDAMSQAKTFDAVCHFGVQEIVVLHPIYTSLFQGKSWMRQATKKALVWYTPAALASLGKVQELIMLAVKEALGNMITSVSVSINIYFICAFFFFLQSYLRN